jgi:type VI secretion system secreted protein Hcp
MSRSVYFSLAAVMMLALAVPASAANIYCTVLGAAQGKFQGDPGVRGDPTQIAVYAITEELKAAYDATTGLRSGKRQHLPVMITKELDKSSPQFFIAAVNDEILKSVTCTLYRNMAEGATRAYYKITLTNATVVEVKDSGDGVNGAAQGDERERISFTYEKIVLTDLDSNISAQDDWTAVQ